MDGYLAGHTVKLPALLLLVLMLMTGCGGGGDGGVSSGGGAQPVTAMLRLGVADQLPAGTTAITGASITLALPAGVTLSGDVSSAVAVSGQALGKLQTAFTTFTPATTTSGAQLSFLLFLIEPVATLTGGELATVKCTVAPGLVLNPADVAVSGFVTNQLDAKIPGVGIRILP